MCGIDGPYKPSPKELKRRQESEDEDDHRQLSRAEEIRSDPKRMAGVLRHHRKQARMVARMGRSIGRR